MKNIFVARRCRPFAAGLTLLVLGACNSLIPPAASNPNFYSLDTTQHAAPVAAPATAPTLIISPPRAAAGFGSPHMIYVRETYKPEYFSHSEWVEPPARMLAPLLLAAIESTGAFHAIVVLPSDATGDLRLDTEVIRLQQEFMTRPSQVRFTLRAYLIGDKTRSVLAWREFEAVVPAASDDPYGGVVAANRAVKTVVENLALFCAGMAASTQQEITH